MEDGLTLDLVYEVHTVCTPYACGRFDSDSVCRT